jgi:hypothetical protein
MEGNGDRRILTLQNFPQPSEVSLGSARKLCNYLTSQPSYRGDQTGEIGMIEVHKNGKLRLPDAPVVMEVGEGEILQIRLEVREKESL